MKTILAETSRVPFAKQIEDIVMSTERVEDRPIGAVLDGVIGPVIAAPAFDAQEPAALVEVLGVELPARLGVGVEELALEEGPGGG